MIDIILIDWQRSFYSSPSIDEVLERNYYLVLPHSKSLNKHKPWCPVYSIHKIHAKRCKQVNSLFLFGWGYWWLNTMLRNIGVYALYPRPNLCEYTWGVFWLVRLVPSFSQRDRNGHVFFVRALWINCIKREWFKIAFPVFRPKLC